MAQDEIHGTRDLTYSAWHRVDSIRRFVGSNKEALSLAMIDIDVPVWAEYDDGTKQPLALIETAQDIGQSMKPTTVTFNLAKMANLPCFVVLYSVSDNLNPAYPKVMDISQFRVKQLWPLSNPEWDMVSPYRWARILLRIRKGVIKNLLDSRYIQSST